MVSVSPERAGKPDGGIGYSVVLRSAAETHPFLARLCILFTLCLLGAFVTCFQRAALLSYFSRSPQANRSARASARVPFSGFHRAPSQTSSDPSPAPSQDFPGGKGCEEGRQTLRLCTECIAVPEVLFRPQGKRVTQTMVKTTGG